MKTRFLFSTIMLWLFHTLLGLSDARASHAQAGELTYFSLGNNQYRVRVTFFRDCDGLPAPASFNLTCRNSCSGGMSVNAILTPPTAGSYTSYTPYCASASNVVACTPNSTGGGRTNTVSINYEATVTLPPAAEWLLSIDENSRPTIANINPGMLRLEATLNNLIIPVGGGSPIPIVNNSPQFNTQSLPVPFVCWQQRSTISFSATDVDRLNIDRFGVGQTDSLVYTLDRPLNGCGTFETYLAYPGGTCMTRVDPRCSSRIIRCQGIPTTYSATLPIAVANDTIYSGPCTPGTITYGDVRPRFSFDAQSASFTFTPSVFNVTLNSPLNKYTVVGKVTEYRKINGRYYKIGSVRRDFLVVVIDCGNNAVPTPPIGAVSDPLSQGTVFQSVDTTVITVRTCNYTRVNLRFTDPNPGDLLTVFAPANLNSTLLQNGDIGSFTLAGNGTVAPSGTFFFQPSANLAGTTILATFRIEDNACPTKGIQYRTVILRVVKGSSLRIGAGATNLAGGDPTTCAGAGAAVLLTGNVQRPDSIRQVASGQTISQTYSYQWTAAASGGLPSNTNTRTIQVTPLVTTRYFLTVVPNLGFAPGCGDTTSVLVRVVPRPAAPTISRTGNTLTSSVATGNQWYLNGQPIPGATGTTYTPTTSGNYTVVTSLGSGPVVCLSAQSGTSVVLGTSAAALDVSVRVAPNPTPDGRVRVQLTGYERPVTLRVHDALGRIVTTTQVAAPNPAGTEQVLNLPGTAAGVYVLQVVGVTGVQVIRLVRE